MGLFDLIVNEISVNLMLSAWELPAKVRVWVSGGIPLNMTEILSQNVIFLAAADPQLARKKAVTEKGSN